MPFKSMVSNGVAVINLMIIVAFEIQFYET